MHIYMNVGSRRLYMCMQMRHFFICCIGAWAWKKINIIHPPRISGLLHVGHLPVCWQEGFFTWKTAHAPIETSETTHGKTVGFARFHVRTSWIIHFFCLSHTSPLFQGHDSQISAREKNHRIFPSAVSNTVAQYVAIVSGAALLPSWSLYLL